MSDEASQPPSGPLPRLSPTAAPLSPTAAPLSPTAAPLSPTAAPLSPMALRPLRLLLSLGAGIIALTLIFATIGYFFRDPLLRFASLFVDKLGGVGVAIGFYIPDAFTIPLPNDAFSVLGLAGGLGFVEVAIWSTVGSLLGGSTGFAIGRRLSKTAWYQRVMQSRGAEVRS